MASETTPPEGAAPGCVDSLGRTLGVGELSSAIVRVGRLHRMMAGMMLRRIGLHPGQELVMMRLWDAGPQRQSDLAKLLGTDAATMTRTVQRLEHGGFVRRIPSTTDKRVTIVEPTTASKALRSEVERVWAELERVTASDLDDVERAQVLERLGRMESSLQHLVQRNRTTADDDAISGCADQSDHP